jgi:hypothetical protein
MTYRALEAELAADQRPAGTKCMTCAWLEAREGIDAAAFDRAFTRGWTRASIHRAIQARGYQYGIASVEAHYTKGHRRP